ncbi:MAG: hypothetical protein DRJ59_03560 [Thermoprotei archaeon]|nr:MAG: hypothetical protein DRJ59_03560 [Thermoprotei archaeon]
MTRVNLKVEILLWIGILLICIGVVGYVTSIWSPEAHLYAKTLCKVPQIIYPALTVIGIIITGIAATLRGREAEHGQRSHRVKIR